MPSEQLENLVRSGQLQRESPDEREIAGLIRSGEERLRDAGRTDLSISSRFDLAYNAAHALALAALRLQGYRPANRYVVFQTLAHTIDLPAEQWRVLATAHARRNNVEYGGFADVDEKLVAAVLRVTHEVATRVKASPD
jgi:hypothetical protein